MAVAFTIAPVRSQQYVFVPGSRQAVRADSPQAQQATQQRGYYRTSGGMGGRSGTQAYQQPPAYSRQQSASSSQPYPSRQAPANWRQAPAATYSTSTSSRQNSAGSTQDTRQKTGSSKDYCDFVKVDGGSRPFWVHLPSNHNKSRATPVVLVFPGLNMSGESMIGVTGLSGTANRNDFIAVYCQALGGEWEDGMKNQRHNDVGYVDAVLQKLGQTTNIDTHRVYAVGLSNGGYFVQLLAASRPEKIAAVAVVASTGMEGAVTRSSGDKPIPIVFFIGSQDPLINWGDGKSKQLGKYASKLGISEIDPSFLSLVQYGGWFSVPDVIRFWTTHNHCQGSPSSNYLPDLDPRDGMRVKKDVWGTRGREVILYTIEGGGHTWPGCILLAGKRQSTCCQDINTGEEIWQFFRGQSR